MAKKTVRRTKKSLSPPRIRASAIALQARTLMSKRGKPNRRKAARLIEKSLRVKADNIDALIARGLLEEKKREPERAKAIYRALLDRPQASDEAHYRLGRLLMSERMTRREGAALLRALVNSGSDSRWSRLARPLLPNESER